MNSSIGSCGCGSTDWDDGVSSRSGSRDNFACPVSCVAVLGPARIPTLVEIEVSCTMNTFVSDDDGVDM